MKLAAGEQGSLCPGPCPSALLHLSDGDLTAVHVCAETLRTTDQCNGCAYLIHEDTAMQCFPLQISGVLSAAWPPLLISRPSPLFPVFSVIIHSRGYTCEGFFLMR